MATARKLLAGEPFERSDNDYDWLGPGIYFWESNPSRGIEFYREARRRKGLSATGGTVVGAVIDLGYCLDLTTSLGTEAVRAAHEEYTAMARKAGYALPKNAGGDDLLQRKLDCAVLTYLHRARHDRDLTPFQSVRGVFQEGAPIYEGAGFRAKTHTQIAVLDQSSIHGVFRVPDGDLRP